MGAAGGAAGRGVFGAVVHGGAGGEGGVGEGAVQGAVCPRAGAAAVHAARHTAAPVPPPRQRLDIHVLPDGAVVEELGGRQAVARQVDAGHQPPRHGAAHHPRRHRAHDRRNLEAKLRAVGVQNDCAGLSQRCEGSHQTSNDAGHAVQIVDTARVAKANGALQEGCQECKAQRGHRSRHQTHCQSTSRGDEKVRCRTHSHTSRQAGVLDVHDVELVADASRHGKGGDAGTQQTDDSVDNDVELLAQLLWRHIQQFFSRVRGQGAIEGRPEDPKRQGADHGEHVGVVRSAVLGVLCSVQLLVAGDEV
mmetsp:Transcript_596/g.1724  ORF Transcript_596/g.1724 Transcript_596/m.1724 type:complete len:306 (+) Transcript_596:462-1379(+)